MTLPYAYTSGILALPKNTNIYIYIGARGLFNTMKERDKNLAFQEAAQQMLDLNHRPIGGT